MIKRVLLIFVWLLLGVATNARPLILRSFALESPPQKAKTTYISRRQLDDDDSWPVGTKVYYQFEDGWYIGTITDFDDMGYTITWEDDTVDIDDYTDDEVDQMVADYQSMVANGGGTPAPAPANDGGGDSPTADDDDSWDIGTKVYWQFDDGWYVGTITDWDDMGYTIDWEDGSQDVDDWDDDDVDQMVENYQTMCDDSGVCTPPAPSPSPAGTTEGGDVSPTADDDDDTWDVGTKVYNEFDDGWYIGTITDWDDMGYTITWEDDSVDVDDYDDDEVDQMVENYQTMCDDNGVCTPPAPSPSPADSPTADSPTADDDDDDSWDIGTKVYYEFEDGWYIGTITDWDDDGYTITWNDGSVDYDDWDDDEVDEMVENYQKMCDDNGVCTPPGGGSGTSTQAQAAGGGDGMAPGAIFVIVAVVCFAIVGVWYFVRRRRFSKEEVEELSPTHRYGTRNIA